MDTEQTPSSSTAGTPPKDVPGASQDPGPQAPKKHRCSKCKQTFDTLLELGEHVLVEINGGVTSPPFPYPYKYDLKHPVWASSSRGPNTGPVTLQIPDKTPAQGVRPVNPALPPNQDHDGEGLALRLEETTPPEPMQQATTEDHERESAEPSPGHPETSPEQSNQELEEQQEDTDDALDAQPVVFPCPTCGQCFGAQKYLNQHNRRMHAERPQGKHRCSHCSYSSDSKSQIIAHERRHTGEKPFVCRVCEKAFRVKGALADHMNVHSGEKRYECQDCGRRFGLSRNLSKHRRIHLKEGKPYACPVCGESFNEKRGLNTHMKGHQE